MNESCDLLTLLHSDGNVNKKIKNKKLSQVIPG